MHNKKLLIGILTLVIVIIFGGLYFFSTRSTAVKPETEEEIATLPITKEELGLTVTPLMGGKKILIEIVKTDDLKVVEYELSYMTKGNTQAAIGEIKVTKGKPIKQEIVLGTCSDVCHYDEDVSEVNLILKVTKTDGKIYQAEEPVNLE